MRDLRLRRISLLAVPLVAVLAAVADVALVRSGGPLLRVALWASLIGAAHAVSTPTTSGRPANAAVVPAIAAAVLLPGTLPVLSAVTSGLLAGWFVVRTRARRGSGVDADFPADAAALVALALVVPLVTGALAEGPLSPAWGRIAAIVVGSAVWYALRSVILTLLDGEREHLPPRSLWTAVTGDWMTAFVLVVTGTVFTVTFADLGIWSLLVAGSTYALGHLALLRSNRSRSTYVQMIRALAQISEVADLAPRGHAVRTAELAVAVAREIGLRSEDVIDLEYAALMHDVGRIATGEAASAGPGYTDDDIARRGAGIIAEAPHLAAVAEYVRAQHHPYRRPGEATDPDVPVVSKIIKVVSAYDQAVHELRLSPLEALERIHRGSAYDFDPAVAGSLRRVLARRRVIAA